MPDPAFNSLDKVLILGADDRLKAHLIAALIPEKKITAVKHGVSFYHVKLGNQPDQTSSEGKEYQFWDVASKELEPNAYAMMRMYRNESKHLVFCIDPNELQNKADIRAKFISACQGLDHCPVTILLIQKNPECNEQTHQQALQFIQQTLKPIANHYARDVTVVNGGYYRELNQKDLGTQLAIQPPELKTISIAQAKQQYGKENGSMYRAESIFGGGFFTSHKSLLDIERTLTQRQQETLDGASTKLARWLRENNYTIGDTEASKSQVEIKPDASLKLKL